MKFSLWTKNQIDTVLLKIERYEELQTELEAIAIRTNEAIYRRYISSLENKKSFLFFKSKPKEREAFFQDTSDYPKLGKVFIYLSDRYIKKYKVKVYAREYYIFSTYREHGVILLKSDCTKMKNALQYCTGGELSAQDVQFLAQLDKGIAELEVAVTNILQGYHEIQNPY